MVDEADVLSDLLWRPSADEDRRHRGIAKRKLDGRGGEWDIVAGAGLLELPTPLENSGLRRPVVERRAAGQDAAVEDAGGEKLDAALRAERQQFVVGGAIEQRVAAREEDHVGVAALNEADCGLHHVRADAYPRRELPYRLDSASSLLHVLLGVVEEHDVDRLQPEPVEAPRERAADALGAEVEDRLQRWRTPELRARGSRLEHAPDLGRDRVLLARPAGEGPSEPLLREPRSVERSRIEEADPEAPCRVHRVGRRLRRDIGEEAPERRRPQSHRRDSRDLI